MSTVIRDRFSELKELKRLPSPSGVALEIMRLAKNDDTTVAQIAQVVRADPALSGRLIQLANSAIHTGQRPVMALPDVVARLGLSVVRNTALSFSLIGANRAGSCAGFDFDAFWSHSLAMGIAAQCFAKHIKVASPDECFVLGLLANMGRLALATVYPEAFSRLLKSAGDIENPALLDLARAEFAMDHAEITAAMLGDWGFPAVFANAALHYGNPERFPPTQGSRTATLAALLALASSVAAICASEQLGRGRALAPLYRRGAALAIDGEELSNLLPPIVQAWQDWGRILTIPTQDVPSMVEIERARQEVPAAMSASTASPVALNVLLVDDDRSMLEVTTSFLLKDGHTVRTAANGDAALQEVLRDPPQVVITDWEMPVMDGLQFCKALRLSAAGRQIYVIIVTGHGTEERLAEAFAAGADDYLNKPVKARELAARLRAGHRFIEVHQSSIRDSAELRAIANELVVANRRLKYLARTDELTGLANRRYAMERLEQELVAAKRKRAPLGVLIGDVDFFKRINDTRGHLQGDAVLRAIAKVLRTQARAEDMVGRVGGEEFMVIAPGVDETSLLTIGERLRVGVSSLRVVDQPNSDPVTISLGATVLQSGDTSARDLIRRCDEALYRAKHDGRNRVVLAKPDPNSPSDP